MTIRTRLTLWYAGMMFATLLAMGALSYRQLVVEPHQEREKKQAPSLPDQVKGANPADLETEDDDLLGILLGCGLPAGLLALVGGWWLTRRALAPVTALTQAVEQMHERNLGEPLLRPGSGDELDRLTEVFNAMTARLQQSFQRIREFTLHASHELKTPLTVMRGEIDTLLQDPSLAPAHRERLLGQLDELDRLAHIVDGLTLLTKADAGQVQLAREPVRLDDLVRDALADAEILARPRGVRVELVACEPLEVSGDRHRLRQLLLNLTDNAIKYNLSQGEVTLALRRAGGAAELVITNTGPGLTPEQQARVFDRFFRGDSSHNTAVEGCGLGLSIAQWIVQAHGGEIDVASGPPGDSLVTARVRLPCGLPTRTRPPLGASRPGDRCSI